jgi:hypothetical protein
VAEQGHAGARRAGDEEHRLLVTPQRELLAEARRVEVDPARFRKELALRGDEEAVLVVTRTASSRVALLCHR